MGHVVGLSLYCQQLLALRVPFKERAPTHPHLGGMRVKALRIYVLDRRKQPESSSLTGSRALDQLRKRREKRRAQRIVKHCWIVIIKRVRITRE